MYDVSNIPRFKIRQVVRGLEGTEEALADELCTQETVDARKGDVPVEPVDERVGHQQFEDKEEPGVLPGERLEKQDSDFDNKITYECMRYGAVETLERDEVTSIQNTTDVRPLQKSMSRAMKIAAASIDAKLQSLLSDQGKNKTFDVQSNNATNPWSSDDGKPLRDLHEAKLQVPERDTLYIGKTDAANLRDHPDLLAESSNFSAGFVGDTELARIIRDKHPEFSTIVVNETMYDDGNPQGKSFNLQYRLPDITWMGVSRDLKMYEFAERSPRTFDDEEPELDVVKVGFERKVSLHRVHNDLGLLFTNTT